MAGNRTRINCLEGNYADHYTTIAHTIVAPTKIYSRISIQRVCVSIVGSEALQQMPLVSRHVSWRPRRRSLRCNCAKYMTF
jgi:hypothetical protein